MLFVLSQISMVAHGTYPNVLLGYTGVNEDLNGDGVKDAVIYYADAGRTYTDSVVVYDGVSNTPLAVFDGTSSRYPTHHYPLSSSRLLVIYTVPSGYEYEVYDNLTLDYTGGPVSADVYDFDDLTGDGVREILIYYGDSVEIYDGSDPTVKLVTYYKPTSASMWTGFPMGDGRILLGYLTTSGTVYFEVYENFTDLVYTSPSRTASGYFSLVAMDYDGDGLLEILLSIPSPAALYTYETSYPASFLKEKPEKVKRWKETR